MKKRYSSPLLEVEELDSNDVLTASAGLNEGNWEIGEAPIFE
jgi:hypothetical protein